MEKSSSRRLGLLEGTSLGHECPLASWPPVMSPTSLYMLLKKNRGCAREAKHMLIKFGNLQIDAKCEFRLLNLINLKP
jgi:hypothetical protein